MSIRAVMTLQAPLHHSEFGGHKSNLVSTRKFPVIHEGQVQKVAAVSGNSLRGRMRRIVMRELMDRCGLAVGSSGYDRIYAAVTNGGTLTGSDNNIQPEAIRDLRAKCPPLSVFGSALYTHMLAGRRSVGICWPVCGVTVAKGLVVTPGALNPSHLEEETSFVRLPEKEHQNSDATKVGPMPYTIEIMPAGTVLESEIRFQSDTTELEMSCVAWALDRVDYLGGKSGIGLGRLELRHDGDSHAYAEWLAGDLTPARTILEAI